MNSPVVNWRNTRKLYNFLGKRGKLLSWTKIYAAPAGFEHEAPYYCGIIQFADGSKKSMQLVEVDESNIKNGFDVITIVRKLGKVEPDEVINYTIKAKLLPEEKWTSSFLRK